ncbi:MAG: aminotransferase class I/II-fold pyridoxal phosphate-dependent enzyme [Candidatus Aureabacteria bacterium]|nr:aminotransferase class I/II-fold pyridoxal phosphate-dependent enzyme [Candidatus Auribacterota bacterium]
MACDPLTPYGNRPMVTPIVNAVNYEYSSFEVLRKITDGEIDGYTYHRDDNPTVRAVEKMIADMEEADDCIVCTTGMAACTMVYFTYLSAGDNLIFFHDIYGANYKVSLILERLGVDITWINADEYKDINKYIKPNTKMIFCETPSNPLCKVVDIQFLSKEAKKNNVMLVVDNTFATPYHQKPLLLGADLVVHSATKGLGGHNDLMAGAIAGTKEHYNDLWFTRQAIGTTLSPYSASLLERGLKTFEMRAKRMADNAYAIAEYLSKHPKISRISYPGLKTDPGHEVAKKQMKDGFGGILAFDVGDDIENAKNFISDLKTIYHAVSLGSCETLICIPFLTTMLYLPVDRRTIFGVNKNTVRLSAGIDKTELLINDLETALKNI